MQTYESLTWTTGDVVPRTRTPTPAGAIGSGFRIDGNAAATLSFSNNRYRDGTGHLSSLLHHVPTSSTRRLRLPHVKSLKDEIDPLTFLVTFE